MFHALDTFFQFVCLDPQIEFIRITLPFHQRDFLLGSHRMFFSILNIYNLVGFQQLLFVTGSPIKCTKW